MTASRTVSTSRLSEKMRFPFDQFMVYWSKGERYHGKHQSKDPDSGGTAV